MRQLTKSWNQFCRLEHTHTYTTTKKTAKNIKLKRLNFTNRIEFLTINIKKFSCFCELFNFIERKRTQIYGRINHQKAHTHAHI